MSDGPVLLCYDGSADARLAIERAAECFAPRPAIVLAVWPRAVVHYSHFWTGAAVAPDLQALDEAAEQVAAATAADGAKFAAAAGLAAERLTMGVTGPVWEAILSAAADADAAVIAMGSRGRGGARSLLLGSVSNAVLHHAARPTLIVRHGAAQRSPPSAPVLLCYDGSSDAKLAIERAAELFGGRPALVLVAWPHARAVLTYSYLGPTDMPGLAALEEDAERAARALASEGAAIAARAGLPAETLVMPTGAVWETIVEAADTRDAAAIVLGSRGLGGRKSMLHGSVSSAVVHHANRPTLVVRHTPSEAAVEPPGLTRAQ